MLFIGFEMEEAKIQEIIIEIKMEISITMNIVTFIVSTELIKSFSGTIRATAQFVEIS